VLLCSRLSALYGERGELAVLGFGKNNLSAFIVIYMQQQKRHQNNTAAGWMDG